MQQRYQQNTHPYQTSMKMQCYYCDGEDSIDTCDKFRKDKEKYNLSRAKIAKKYCKQILKNVRRAI